MQGKEKSGCKHRESNAVLLKLQAAKENRVCSHIAQKNKQTIGDTKRFFLAGRKQTACSKAGSQDSRMQIGVFKDKMASPWGQRNGFQSAFCKSTAERRPLAAGSIRNRKCFPQKRMAAVSPAAHRTPKCQCFFAEQADEEPP